MMHGVIFNFFKDTSARELLPEIRPLLMLGIMDGGTQ